MMILRQYVFVLAVFVICTPEPLLAITGDKCDPILHEIDRLGEKFDKTYDRIAIALSDIRSRTRAHMKKPKSDSDRVRIERRIERVLTPKLDVLKNQFAVIRPTTIVTAQAVHSEVSETIIKQKKTGEFPTVQCDEKECKTVWESIVTEIPVIKKETKEILIPVPRIIIQGDLITLYRYSIFIDQRSFVFEDVISEKPLNSYTIEQIINDISDARNRFFSTRREHAVKIWEKYSSFFDCSRARSYNIASDEIEIIDKAISKIEEAISKLKSNRANIYHVTLEDGSKFDFVEERGLFRRMREKILSQYEDSIDSLDYTEVRVFRVLGETR